MVKRRDGRCFSSRPHSKVDIPRSKAKAIHRRARPRRAIRQGSQVPTRARAIRHKGHSKDTTRASQDSQVTQELRGRKVLLSRRALLRSPRRPLSQESCPPLGLSSSYLASTSGAGNQPHKEAVEEMLLVILRTVTWKMKDRAPRKASRLATDNVLCVSAERQSAWRSLQRDAQVAQALNNPKFDDCFGCG